MIYSMTAYSRLEQKAQWGQAAWEIRSVNQRYLETNFRLPEQFRALEAALRDKLKNELQRGKVEVSLRFNQEHSQGELLVNEQLCQQLMKLANQLAAQSPHAQVNPLDILKWPGVMEAQEADFDAISSELLAGFDRLLADFIEGRKREGSTIEGLINQRLEGIQVEVNKVRAQLPQVMQWQREKLTARFNEAKLELDSSRLEQEMVYTLQKLDVAEELDRLESHLKECKGIMKRGGAVGRRLDFMMQEFNREANTLASKSINADVTTSAVELKVLIEQMREQIQNLE